MLTDRLYFGRDGATLVILLCAGNKRKQDKDIEKAIELWREYKQRQSPKRGQRC